jgi:hypothetical protein
MADNTFTSVSLSRDSIRDLLIQYAKTYLELESIDLTKSSFLSFMINSLATLTSNVLFYNLSSFREFFMTTAQTDEAIYNLAAFLGYEIKDATYSTCDVLLTFPLTDDFVSDEVQFTISDKVRFYAGDVEFRPFYTTHISISSGQPTVTITSGNASYTLNVSYTTRDGVPCFSILLPTRQYTEIEEEFQVDSDLGVYQFFEKEILFSGNNSGQQLVSDRVTVFVKEPSDSSSAEYDKVEGSSLYQMEPNEKAFVLRKSVGGFKVYFGNGLIGYRPKESSTITITYFVTRGAAGKVIPGAISTGDRIYYEDSEIDPNTHQTVVISKMVKYYITNTYGAIGGKDSETIDEIRRNAIISLTARNRLVTENDFREIKTIIPTLPISEDVIPILKRADTQVNEIQLYTPLVFDHDDDGEEEIVRTRSVYYPQDTTADEEIILEDGQIITAGTEIILDDGVSYLTLFDMTVDLLNKSATYIYNVKKINQTPSFNRRFTLTPPDATYNMIGTGLTVDRIEGTDNILFTLSYISDETDCDTCTCTIDYNGTPEGMTNNGTNEFTITKPYLDFTTGELSIFFIIAHPSYGNLVEYENNVIIRQGMDNFMLSNITYTYAKDESGEIIYDEDENPTYIDAGHPTIYDIPVIQKEQYENWSDDKKEAFELNVLQQLLNSMDLKQYRMLTDFVNLKFTNTFGTIQNIHYNIPTYKNVRRTPTYSPPSPPDINTVPIRTKYLINGTEGGIWANYKDYIVENILNNDVREWSYYEPKMDDIVSIADEKTIDLVTSNIETEPGNGIYRVKGITSINHELEKGSEIVITDTASNIYNQTWEIGDIIDSTSFWLEDSIYSVDSTGIYWEEGVGVQWIYGNSSWIYPQYTMPLDIILEVKRSTSYSGTASGLSTAVRNAVYENLQPLFGNDAELYMSQIVDIVQEVEGVSHCRLISPNTNIFFNFELGDLDHSTLLKYAPEYIFTELDKIQVTIL